MHESRWMRQTNSKIRIGPEYQAVLPDLLCPEARAGHGKGTQREEPEGGPSGGLKDVGDKTAVRAGPGQGPKSSTPSSTAGAKQAKSEKESPHVKSISTSESAGKLKSLAKTQKTISKPKTGSKSGSRSSK
ncbi:hypothetical protein OJ253_824 [Cryptosporidium canis]|uniref:ELM2 domain-containing protein n=1 Tax=Cryptosporidium canis TaxID=195482 RepID=A0A9D5HYC3_9CRYT|nr:hypothetical protein OJ253_824 [Cryptosporidium canis]